jgi:tetratricopeptide (TPR) repeat protein
LSRIRLDSGKFEEALELALVGQDIAPEYPDIYDALSSCYEALGKKAKAKKMRAKALELGFVDEED